MAKKREVTQAEQHVVDWVGSKAGSRIGVGSAIGIMQSLKKKETPKLSDGIGLVSKSPVGVALSLTALQAEKEKENIAAFQKNKNRGKKSNLKESVKNNIVSESTSVKKISALQNAKNFVSNKKK